MSGPKILMAVLLLIGILFAVVLYIGATHSDDKTFQKPRWMTDLSTAMVSQQSLKIADLSHAPASCLQQGSLVVPMGGTCTFDIQQSVFVTRVVRLQLVQGVSARVTLTQEQTLDQQEQLPSAGANATPNDDLKVYPGKANGRLVIECLDAGGTPECRLELK
jgi:hypothetical protein